MTSGPVQGHQARVVAAGGVKDLGIGQRLQLSYDMYGCSLESHSPQFFTKKSFLSVNYIYYFSVFFDFAGFQRANNTVDPASKTPSPKAHPFHLPPAGSATRGARPNVPGPGRPGCWKPPGPRSDGKMCWGENRRKSDVSKNLLVYLLGQDFPFRNPQKKQMFVRHRVKGWWRLEMSHVGQNKLLSKCIH